MARLKFETYNLRKEADVEYTAVCGVVTCKDEKTRLVMEEKEKCIGLELAAIKRNVDDIVESRTKLISMCNQMVTSEIREQFHARSVQIPIISRAFRRGKLSGFGQNASVITPQLHEYTI